MQDPSTEPDAFVASIVLERARWVTPLVWFGIAMALVLSEPIGIPVPRAVLVWNSTTLVLLTLLMLALHRRWVPARHAHVLLGVMWLLPVAGTLLSRLLTNTEILTYALLIEIAAAAMMLDTRVVLAVFLLLDLAWVPLVLVQADENLVLDLVVVGTMQFYTLIFHLVARNALLRTEAHRREHEATAQASAAQLAELRASEGERAQLADQLLHAQRMETAGTLAAGLAHDMNNILGSIQSFAELLLERHRETTDTPADETSDDLCQIVHQAERGAHLTRGLLAFSRRGQYRKQVLEVDPALQRLVPLLARMLPKTIALRTDLGATDARLQGDPTQLDQVIVNLVVNAADAIRGNGEITLSSTRTDLGEEAASALGIPPGAYVRVQVTDSGAGMDEATRRRVFEPFFTTKPLGRGTGLGLSTVWGVVQGHNGAVGVASQVGAGTTFTIHLPETMAPVAMAPSRTAPATVHPPPLHRPTVLVVDDEPAVRAGTARILQRKGYAVMEAANGADALEVFAAHAREISLVILDMGMPVMAGPECFARLRTLSDVPVLIATGYSSDEQAQALTTQGAALIEKPFAARELTATVGRLLGRSSTRTPVLTRPR